MIEIYKILNYPSFIGNSYFDRHPAIWLSKNTDYYLDIRTNNDLEGFPGTGFGGLNVGMSAGNKYAFEIETYLNDNKQPRLKLTINERFVGEYYYTLPNDEELKPMHISHQGWPAAEGEITDLVYEKINN